MGLNFLLINDFPLGETQGSSCTFYSFQTLVFLPVCKLFLSLKIKLALPPIMTVPLRSVITEVRITR